MFKETVPKCLLHACYCLFKQYKIPYSRVTVSSKTALFCFNAVNPELHLKIKKSRCMQLCIKKEMKIRLTIAIFIAYKIILYSAKQ